MSSAFAIIFADCSFVWCQALVCRSGSKDICTLQHGFLCFLLFLHLDFHSLACIITHLCFFIPSARSLRFGSRPWKVKLSSHCHNQWLDTVSTNLGKSLGFDHNDKKKCAFPHARHVYSLENYFTGGRCRLAWRVLTLADENYRGEPHEVLVKCFIKFVYPWFARN